MFFDGRRDQGLNIALYFGPIMIDLAGVGHDHVQLSGMQGEIAQDFEAVHM